MLNIIGMLFAGWFLNLFGFGAVVITGLSQVFGIAITMTGYYFLFAMVGVIKSILGSINSYGSKIKLAKEYKK